VAYNAATGGQLWAENFSDSATEDSEPSSLAVSPDGATVFVTGSATAASGGATRSYVTVAYNASTGARRWVARLGGAIQRFARAIAASPDGSKVFVFGHSRPPNTNTEEYTTIAYNPGTGAQLWVANFANRGTANFASAMAVSPDGSKVFVTGTEGLGHRAIATVAYQS
jgi:outer membrane protein assembly factor BamB